MVVAHTVKSSAQVPFDILTSQSLHHAANPKRTDGEQKQNEKLYLDFIKRSTILETLYDSREYSSPPNPQSCSIAFPRHAKPTDLHSHPLFSR